MIYVGDLSIQDVNVLCRLAANATSIIEFGVGASTQVFAQASDGKIRSVETDPAWIERTTAILDLLRLRHRVEFVIYKQWNLRAHPPVDLIFDDGVDQLRLDFAEKAWPLLKVGGALVFHDTRRQHDFNNATIFCQNHFTEIDNIAVNTNSSNLTVVTKKVAEPYVNWNVSEGRPAVAAGYASLHETLAFVRQLITNV